LLRSLTLNLEILKNIMVIKMYFRLNPESYFIRGENRGAIFDLIDGKIYVLDRKETRIVTSCEMNNPIHEGERFLDELKQLCLGNFYTNRVYIQKLRVGSPLAGGERIDLHRAFLEINNTCNRDCWFCGCYGIKRNFGCMGCNKWRDNGTPLSEKKWKEIVDDLSDLGCRDIFITGGDLTLAWNKTINILDHANRKFNNMYIILHEQSLSSNIYDNLNGKVNLIIQTDRFNGHRSKDSANILVIKPENWKEANDIEDKAILKDFIITDKNSLSKDLPIMSKEKVSPVNMHTFLNNIDYHPCLGRTLAICNNGDVIPCPMLRKHSFGNISDRKLCTIFEKNIEKIYNFWRLNLDKIEKCTGCEFRYACSDCRALEENLTGKLDGKMLCSYSPEKGEWL